LANLHVNLGPKANLKIFFNL